MLVFPVIPMALLAHGLTAPEWRIASAGAYALVEIFDSCALLAGKLFGRRKAGQNRRGADRWRAWAIGAQRVGGGSAGVGWWCAYPDGIAGCRAGGGG